MVVAVASLFLTTVAEAHVRVEKTHLKLQVSDKQIRKGETVKFTGTLTSNWSKCYANRPVKLMRDGVVKRSKKTNVDGIVKWTWDVRATGKWQLWFKGRKWGEHPHRHVCKPSYSNIIKITVTSP
jgi:hypothetical protein